MKKAYCIIILTIISAAMYSQTLGDVNNNGVIDIVDSLLTAQYYVNLRPSPFYTSAANVNCDRNIDIIDALLIAQYYVGLKPFFPCSPVKKLNIPLYKQEKIYYCGPASAKMYVHYQRINIGSYGPGSLPSQTSIYNLMKTYDPSNSLGIHISYFSNGLNNLMYNYTSTLRDNYTKLYLENYPTKYDDLQLRNKATLIDRYEPSVVAVQWGTNQNSHYVVFKGYERNSAGSITKVYFCDPENGNNMYMLSSDWYTDYEIIDQAVNTPVRAFIAY